MTWNRQANAATLPRRVAIAFAGLALAMGSASADAAKGGTQRPYSSECDTVVHTADFVNFTIDLRCKVRHLGLTTGTFTQVADFLGVDNAGNVLLGIHSDDVTYTAANGDELWSSFVGTATVSPGGDVTYGALETFGGGTGRFEDASGQAALRGVATSIPPTVGFYASVGTISY